MEDALVQFEAAAPHGVAMPAQDLANHVIREALLMAAVDLSVFEIEYLRATTNAAMISPAQAQITAGWIIRAYLAGRRR